MRRRLFIFGAAVLMAGCRATHPAFPLNTEERLVAEGKLLYELGRTNEARSRLQLVLAETKDGRLRASASYYVGRIDKGLGPEKGEPGVPRCFGP